MAVTPVGNPYVESSDLVANYPGASEALAERIDIVGVNPFANAAARDAAIPSPVQGQMCSLNDDNKGYRYDGSAWVLFSGAGPANFTNTATGTYTDGGIDYKYITFTGSGSLVVDRAGRADVLLISAGGAGATNAAGAGGRMIVGEVSLPVGTLTVTVGAINSIDSFGGFSELGTLATGVSPLWFGGNNPKPTTDDNNATTGLQRGRTSSITGAALEYGRDGRSGAPTANRGDGGVTGPGNNGSAGVVIVRVVV